MDCPRLGLPAATDPVGISWLFPMTPGDALGSGNGSGGFSDLLSLGFLGKNGFKCVKSVGISGWGSSELILQQPRALQEHW